MGTNDKAVNHGDQIPVPQPSDRPPERGLANILILTDLGLFSVYYSVIGPIPEEPEYRFALPVGKAQRELQKIKDSVLFLYEKLL